MIIDVHSHAWRYPAHFGDDFVEQASRAKAGGKMDLAVRYDEYRKAATGDTRTWSSAARHAAAACGSTISTWPNTSAAHPDTLVGFLSVDPTQDGWQREMHLGHRELGLKGIKLLPMYAGFRPDDDLLDPLWVYAVAESTCRCCCTPARRSFRRPCSNTRCRGIWTAWRCVGRT